MYSQIIGDGFVRVYICHTQEILHFKYVQLCCLVAQSCQTLSQPHGLQPTRLLSVGISQERILEWVAISLSSMCSLLYVIYTSVSLYFKKFAFYEAKETLYIFSFVNLSGTKVINISQLPCCGLKGSVDLKVISQVWFLESLTSSLSRIRRRTLI